MVSSVRPHVVKAFRRRGWDGELSLALGHIRRARRSWHHRFLLMTAPPALRRESRSAADVLLTTSAKHGQAVLARRRDDPSVIAAIEHHAHTVRECLDLAGIPYRVSPISSPNRTRVSVLEGDRVRAADALGLHAPPTQYVYADAAEIAPRRRLQRIGAGALGRGPIKGPLARAEVWRVFEFLADPNGTDLLGDLHGCEIEFWEHDPATDTVTAGRSNLVATSLPLERFESPDRTADTRRIGTIDFPVDLVYTWVDGDDPKWRRRRSEADGEPAQGVHPEAASAARYTSYDELRYSLRSVERYADFVRHVYLVTDSQRPSWLRDDHPRVTVVDHREIFANHGDLPTFNSHAIESRLHHVPGLSEHYVYMNDDFLFGRRVQAERFFLSNGLAQFFESRALVPLGGIDERTKPVDMAAMNGRDLIAAEFGVHATRKMRHAPYPQLRSVHLDIEQRFPEEVARTTASRVRGRTDLSMASFLHHHVAYVTGRAVPGRVVARYVDLGEPNLERRLDRLLWTRNYDTLCLNDSDTTERSVEVKRRNLRRFLESCFPEPSSFERT